ncbi:MAG: hypothetical protein ACJ788_02190 [Ktedonobacteraceae bacterium]|jgi:hypothetical protein
MWLDKGAIPSDEKHIDFPVSIYVLKLQGSWHHFLSLVEKGLNQRCGQNRRKAMMNVATKQESGVA